jgi:hypothetical protein
MSLFGRQILRSLLSKPFKLWTASPGNQARREERPFSDASRIVSGETGLTTFPAVQNATQFRGKE